MRYPGFWIPVLLCSLALSTVHSALAVDEAASTSMRLSIDARGLARKLIDAELCLPITASEQSQKVALWYPKWVPGSHGPGGPVANIAGLQIRSSSGEILNWKRSPGEVYRLEVEVPAGEEELHLSVRYLSNQPTTTSFGHDCFASSQVGVISPGCLVLYAEGIDIDQQRVSLDLRIPDGWNVASALPFDSESNESGSEAIHQFESVTLRTLVDSPLMFGRHYQSFELVKDTDLSPPHTLHVFGDDEIMAQLSKEVIAKYASMVEQTSLLIGSHPFDRFDILLAVTNELPKNGLEHSRSTFNVLPPSSMRSAAALKGWDRLLVPHEYLHAWCGKFRRPTGMLTSDFHTAKDTELLWVYEGLTQYLGELVEARSGMMSPDEFRHRLFVELRNATHQQGRRWRTLADTAAASHILRSASPMWGGLRRSQDYYMEGMLFWLEADARIRKLTNDQRSLDDFCQAFFNASRDNQRPSGFDRDEIVSQLNAIAKFDWDGLIARRVESFQQSFDPAVANSLGYSWKLAMTQPKIPTSTFRHGGGVDLLDSLGMSVTSTGQVRRVLLDSPADQAKLLPTTQIIGIGENTWSGERLREAVRRTIDNEPVEILIKDGDRLRSVQIHYYDGLRFWNLVRDESQPDRLRQILQPRKRE
ncbi:MAG: hypothetical protein AAGG48_07375 [Planctomycetota bacterium]